MRYLGIDWGQKRVGLAISEGSLATPLKTVSINSLEDGLEKISRIAYQESIDLLIIGLPGGVSGKMAQKAILGFQKRGFVVYPADETLSTQKAQKIMLEIGLKKQDRREDNALAASIILQEFLDQKS